MPAKSHYLRRRGGGGNSPLPYILLAITLPMLFRLGDLPAFCDEVLIGIRAQNSPSLNSLFYDHFDTLAGTLPVITTAPFVHIFGLSDVTLRLPSLLFTTASAIALWRTLVHLCAPAPWFGVLIFLGTPQVLHMSRLNFGHAPSLFLLSVACLLWARQGSMPKAILSGLCLGLAAYGYPGYMVLVPIVLVVFLFCAPMLTRDANVSRRFSVVACISGFLIYIPIIIQAAVNSERFWSRMHAKSQTDSAILDVGTISTFVQNYPKYFGLGFLFITGENGDRLATILRHSISDSGLLLWAFLPLALSTTIRLLVDRSRYPRRWAIPFVVLMWASPIPDLLTTTPDTPPYSFAISMSLFCIPFVASAGVADFQFYMRQLFMRPVRIIRPLTVVAVVQIAIVIFALLPAYPWHASGYWGWQYGMEPIITYYEEHRDEYSSLRVDPWFNQPKTLAFYYLEDDHLLNTIDFALSPASGEYAPSVLVAISDKYASLEIYEAHGWTLVQTFTYPNGHPAWYLITPPDADHLGQGRISSGANQT